MSGHYPFDANGNLLEGLVVVDGRIEKAVPTPAAEPEASEPEAAILSPEPAEASVAAEPETSH